MRTTIFVAIGIILIVIALGIGFFWGNTRALNKLSIVSVTPDQMAAAMHADDFYSNWRESTLVASSTVTNVIRQDGDTLIQLKTASMAQVYCNIGQATTSLAIGDSATFVAGGERASRIANGVMLTGCKAW